MGLSITLNLFQLSSHFFAPSFSVQKRDPTASNSSISFVYTPLYFCVSLINKINKDLEEPTLFSVVFSLENATPPPAILLLTLSSLHCISCVNLINKVNKWYLCPNGK